MMKMNSYCYKYPRPAMTADCVVWGLAENQLNLLLIERAGEPFKGQWAFPGGFMEMEETLEACARREVKEETGIELPFMCQIGAFSAVERDPRDRVVTVAFYSIVHLSDMQVQAGDDATRAGWFDLKKLPALAFDHAEILAVAIQRIQEELTACAEGQAPWKRGFEPRQIEEIRRLLQSV